MDLTFTLATIKALVKAGAKSPEFKADHWRDLRIDIRQLDPKDIPIIQKVLKKEELWGLIENRRVVKKLDAWKGFEAHGPHKAVINRLELLADAIRDLIAKTPRKWLFKPHPTYGVMLPYFVSSAKYHPPERAHGGGQLPAHVDVELHAVSRGHKVTETITFHHHDIMKKRKTAEALLAKKDVFLETEALVADYQKDLEKYKREAPKTGDQYNGRGSASTEDDSRWSRNLVSLDREGMPGKLVMDDGREQGDDSGFLHTKFWAKKGLVDEDEEEEIGDDDKPYALPAHPVIRAFHLWKHEFVYCHVQSIEPYEYDEKAAEKLVLPAGHRELIDALTDSGIQKMEDIVKGKAAGIIVGCSGLPGTGKTLTAEVYSEAAKRPLYTVQCSQLGTNEENLEEKLITVLDRATRWRAILLIDEADVYVYERGSDLHQNAIVGVFLRVLEYFSGILFMTTNRATVIDDAILSRMTAHVRYGIPDSDAERRRLWEILTKQYGVETLNIATAMKEFPKVSGRSVRQLIRLAKIMADREGKKVTVPTLKRAAAYHDFTEGEESSARRGGPY